jgi:nitrate/nitrite transporter NarK
MDLFFCFTFLFLPPFLHTTAGRMAWGALSDKIGRKETFTIFTLACIPAYFSVPHLVDSVVTSGETIPLYLFCGATMLAVSGMGAAFAILPAYEAELFGTKHVSAVHGRMLMFSSTAGALGTAFFIYCSS